MRQTNWPLIAILLMVVLAAGFGAGFYLHRHARLADSAAARSAADRDAPA